MKTYHKDIYIPVEPLTKVCNRRFDLVYSNHAKQACLNDRYGLIKPVLNLIIIQKYIIELTLNDYNNVDKLLIRMKHNESNDTCLILLPDDTQAIVKTIWLCKATDTHSTLNKTQFATN